MMKSEGDWKPLNLQLQSESARGPPGDERAFASVESKSEVLQPPPQPENDDIVIILSLHNCPAPIVIYSVSRAF